MVIFFYSFCRMDKVYTYSVHWGGIVHIQEKVNYPQWMGELPSKEGRIADNGRANFNSPTPQFAHIAKFTHVANSFTLQFTHVDGRIAIRPYTYVIRTLANIHINHVNTQKKTSWAWYEGICVCRRGELQFAHTTICPYCKIHPHYNSPMLQFTHTTICLHHSLKIAGSGRRQRCYV